MLPTHESLCVGRADLSPQGAACPKREQCQRYLQLRNAPAPITQPVYTHVCGQPELERFAAVEG